MKHVLLLSIFLSFQVYFYAQEMALDVNNVANSDLNYFNHEPVILNSGNSELPWPDCVAPVGLTTITMDGNVRIIWDGERIVDDHYRIRIKKKSESEWIYQSINNNYFDLPKNAIIEDIDFEVQRICIINSQEVQSEWVKLSEIYLAINESQCNTINQQLDDNEGTNAQYYAVYQKTGSCLYIKWNLPNSFMRPGFLLNGTQMIVNHTGQFSGDTIIMLTPTQNTIFQFVEMKYYHDPGGECTYLCPVFFDYFGIYSDQCPVPCTNSNYCDYVNSILGNTTNNYYALANHEQGSSCINFKWNFQNQINDCSGASIESIKINLLNGSNSTTVFGPVNQLSGDIIYDLPQGVSFTDVEYIYTSNGGISGNQTCSYIVNRTFADFNITPMQCTGNDPMSFFCDLNYNFLAVASSNSVIMSVRPNSFDNNEFLEYLDQYNVDSIAVFFDFGQYGKYRASLYKGQSNFNLFQWSYQINGVSLAQIVSPIDILVFKDGGTQGEGCPGYGSVEIQLNGDPDKTCDILSLLLQSNPIPNSIKFDFIDPTNPSYLENKLKELGFESKTAGEIFFKSKVKRLKFRLTYQYLNSSNNTITQTLEKNILNSNGIPFNDVSPLFESTNFNKFQPFATMEILVSKNLEGNYDFSCFRYEIDYKAPKLPTYSCEGSYEVPIIDSTEMLKQLVPGDMAEIAGFSFIVTSVRDPNISPFSGQGILAHPFTLAGKEPILVNFYNIKLNSKKKVYAGVVRGVEASAQEFAQMGFNTVPDTFSIGGDICQPPPTITNVDPQTGVDAWGFGPDSINVNTGNRYDENGFDMNGYYNGTSSKFNKCGCSRDGLDTLGNVCDPTCFDNPEIKDFVDSVKTVIDQKVDILIDDLLQKLTDSLVNLNCNQYRQIIDAKIQNKGFERKYIVGDGETGKEKYYKEGMSTEFAEEPKILSYREETRDQDVIALEKAHVDLYICDKKEILFKKYQKAIQDIGKEKVVETIKKELETLTLFQVQQFKANQEEFVKWLNKQIAKIVDENSETSYNIHNPLKHPNINGNYMKLPPMDEDFSSSFYALAAENTGSDIFNIKSDPKGERLFLYDQGYKEIKGLDRGYYLDELYNLLQLSGGAFENTDFGVAIKLPLKLASNKDGIDHDIFIDNIELKPSGAKLDAYFVLTIPDSKNDKPKKLIFKTLNMSFGTNGIQNGEMQLGSAIDIRLSNAVKMKIKPTNKTFVHWNCKGFDGFGLDLGFEVCRNLIVPLDPNTLQEIPGDVRYTVDVSITASSWSNIYVEINSNQLNPFAIAGYNDLKWQVKNLVFDFSYLKSTNDELPAFFVPTQSDLMDPDLDFNKFKPEWKGIFMKSLKVYLPQNFTANSQPKSIDVDNLMINDLGISCMVGGTNLIDLETGSLGGWAFSINDFYLKIWQTKLLGGGFGGKINVPVFEGTMDYSASIDIGNKYSFKVMPDSIQKMNMFLASAHIDTTSNISVYFNNGDFTCIATLNGNIKAKTDSSSIKIKFPVISFQGLTISNKDPYFSTGTWGYDSLSVNAQLFGFGINLSNIKVFSPEPDYAGISFKLSLNLVDALGINADGGFNIIGKRTQDNLGRQKWIYDRIQLTELGIDVEFSAGHIKGKLITFEEDPIYGKGFQGWVDMQFTNVGRVSALALFGKKGTNENNYKYFMIDGLLEMSTGIMLGPLNINGFAGGVSYHMNKTGKPQLLNTKPPNFPQLGTSLSGVKYTPDIDFGIGLKAGVAFNLAKNEKVMHGSLNFEILFNSVQSDQGGGIHSISLSGQAKILADLNGILPLPDNINKNIAPNLSNASIIAWVDFSYNFNEKVFDGTIVSFLNTPGGMLTGAGTNGKMMDATIHFDPKVWYIYIGTPTNRCGIAASIPLIGTASLSAYLDIGNNVPDMREIDERVRSIAHQIKSNDMFRNSGAGFVFGASLNINANLNVGIGNARLSAGLGFDMMLRKFEGATCAGTNYVPGINGWYAMGQMWAYIEGNLQILGINILEAGIAAVLQAQLPNPFYAQATVAVKFKTLGIKYTKQLDIEFGNKCTLISNSSNGLDMEVINVIDPPDNSTAIEVNRKPEVTLNLPLDKDFEVPDLNGHPVLYNCHLKEISMMSEKYGNIEYNLIFNADKTLITIDPQYMFYSYDTINVSVSIDVMKNGLFFITETKTISFITADGLNTIPSTNILASYPVDGMYNFYKEEWNENKGYIYLEEGQPELFYVIPEDVDQKIKLTDESGNSIYFDYNYNGFENLIEFPLLPDWLINEDQYELEIVRVPKGTYTNTDMSGYGKLIGDPGLLTATGTDKYIDPQDEPQNDNAIETAETALLRIYFRVSKFNTICDKINSWPTANQIYVENEFGFPYSILSKSINSIEPFDNFELNGTDKNDQLLTLNTSDVVYSNWFKNYTNIYDRNFPFEYKCGYNFKYTIGNYLRPKESFNHSSFISSEKDLFQLKINKNSFDKGKISLSDFNQKLYYAPTDIVAGDFSTLKFQLENIVSECNKGNSGSQLPGNGNRDLNEHIDRTGIVQRSIDPEEENGDFNWTPKYLGDIYAMSFIDIPNGSYKVIINYKLPNKNIIRSKSIILSK